ncbi:hypothetical protein NC652_010014 [Populus alba x Populus x berolinensis]|nr:hypothetical protein NC652_010014 [Populus alba x Populus x berolinensis]
MFSSVLEAKALRFALVQQEGFTTCNTGSAQGIIPIVTSSLQIFSLKKITHPRLLISVFHDQARVLDSTHKKGELEQINRTHLAGQIKLNSLKKFGENAEKCLADNYCVDRPSIGDVLMEFGARYFQLQESWNSEHINRTTRRTVM